MVTLKKEADRKKLHENMFKGKSLCTEEDVMSGKGDNEQFVKTMEKSMYFSGMRSSYFH